MRAVVATPFLFGLVGWISVAHLGHVNANERLTWKGWIATNVRSLERTTTGCQQAAHTPLDPCPCPRPTRAFRSRTGRQDSNNFSPST